MNKRMSWHDTIIYKIVFWKSNKMKDVLCASITCNYLINCCSLSHSLPNSTQQLKCCHISVNHKSTKAGNLIFSLLQLPSQKKKWPEIYLLMHALSLPSSGSPFFFSFQSLNILSCLFIMNAKHDQRWWSSLSTWKEAGNEKKEV